MLRAIRWILGRLILALDALFSPKGMKRSPEVQAQVDEATAQLAIYQYYTCPFCVKVRREAKRLSLNIEYRDALNNADHRQALAQQGGKTQVPCLRITDDDGSERWLYESSDIVDYLQQRFAMAN